MKIRQKKIFPRTVNFDVNYSAGVTSPTTLTAPVDNATGVSTTTTFSWAADANATSYHLLVADSGDFSNLLVDEIVEGTSFEVIGSLIERGTEGKAA